MTDLISVEEARRRVLAEVRPLPSEEVPLAEALDRVLAQDVTSAVDVPPFDTSAMDGFAVAAQAEGELAVAGESRAGWPAERAVEPGIAVRISTGAAVPEGTVAVVPVERVTAPAAGGALPDRIAVPPARPGANIRRAGEDVRAGDTVLRAGSPLGPAALGVLASLGIGAVACARRPRVAMLATGDELVGPGGPLGSGQIWSSNPVVLAAQVQRAGGAVSLSETVPDEADATRHALARGVAASDVLCVSGGVSVGPHDHVKAALAEVGVEERFWGVALRPGKPTWFGTVDHADRHVLVFGLPGNPVSAAVTFQLFVRPALRALQGADPAAARATALLTEAMQRNPRRDEAVRCRLAAGPQGWQATPTGPQGSHVLTSMLGAAALALVRAGEGSIAPGERVEIELLD